jgi:hypothetical protein
MPVPIICLDLSVRQFAAALRHCFSKPQFQYFVTVLLGLLLCQEPHTLSARFAPNRSVSQPIGVEPISLGGALGGKGCCQHVVQAIL